MTKPVGSNAFYVPQTEQGVTASKSVFVPASDNDVVTWGRIHAQLDHSAAVYQSGNNGAPTDTLQVVKK